MDSQLSTILMWPLIVKLVVASTGQAVMAATSFVGLVLFGLGLLIVGVGLVAFALGLAVLGVVLIVYLVGLVVFGVGL